MRICHLLPEFEEGGVERHVLSLANAQALRGYDVLVISAGGKLKNLLKGPEHRVFPVHKKNPLTILLCAFRIAWLAKREKVDVLHAHSRVPVWITWWASSMSGVPWIATCHAYYSKNAGLIPYGRAQELLCVSKGVHRFFSGLFPNASIRTLYNGLEKTSFVWGPSTEEFVRFLFIGRLTPKKGIGVLLEAFARIQSLPWFFDVVGDGSLADSLKKTVLRLGISQRVYFHGFQDTPEEWLANCSCFLFPSLEEGMGLTLMRAISMGVPVLSSDLPPVRELALSSEGLLTPGDAGIWSKALEDFIHTRKTHTCFDAKRIPTVDETICEIERVYQKASRKVLS